MEIEHLVLKRLRSNLLLVKAMLRFAKDAYERGFDAVFCMGGDGTVNETVNGIAQGGFKSTFGFVPVGTVNDMSRALGIHQNPTQAIKRIDINQTRTIDIGRCNDRYFCNNIAAGAIPKVIRRGYPKGKEHLGPLAYFLRAGKPYLQQRTTHTASKQRMTILFVNPHSFLHCSPMWYLALNASCRKHL